MTKFQSLFSLPALALTLVFQNHVIAAESDPASRLTVEVRDGSRIVGTSAAEKLKFHSALLGDLKLEVKAIRSVDCANTNSARLTMVSGDTLTVSFVDSALAVKTAFGKVEFAVNSVRTLSVAPSGKRGARREGLVLFWAGTGDSKDNFGTDPDTAPDLRSSRTVKVADNAGLVSMQETRQLTFEAWIKPNSVSCEFPVLLAKGSNHPGTAYGGYVFMLNSNGDNDLIFASGTGMVDTHHANGNFVNNHLGQWIHVAFALDDRAKAARFFVNGKPANDEFDYDTYFHSRVELDFNRPCNLFIGSPDPSLFQGNVCKFDGEMRDVTLFNRALSPEEIRADFETGISEP